MTFMECAVVIKVSVTILTVKFSIAESSEASSSVTETAKIGEVMLSPFY